MQSTKLYKDIFKAHRVLHLFKNYLDYYVINMKFFLNWIKYTEEVFRCVLFQINYLQKLSTNQRTHQILGEKKKHTKYYIFSW